MKTKNKNHANRPFHLHMEYFFRKQYCVGLVLALMAIAMIKTDARVIGLVRQAYAQGFGMVGQYMREETTRVPISFEIAAKLPTMSGK
ncbi:MAG TPA: hypothetical protein VLH38_01220 [Patescibacteria group bacterium]|nr:hypothetical protein [Patescibacteria group bacterium]